MAGNKNSGRKRRVRIVELDMMCDSIAQAALVVRGDQGSISDCLSGKRKTHKGYHYEDPEKEKR